MSLDPGPILYIPAGASIFIQLAISINYIIAHANAITCNLYHFVYYVQHNFLSTYIRTIIYKSYNN